MNSMMELTGDEIDRVSGGINFSGFNGWDLTAILTGAGAGAFYGAVTGNGVLGLPIIAPTARLFAAVLGWGLAGGAFMVVGIALIDLALMYASD